MIPFLWSLVSALFRIVAWPFTIFRRNPFRRAQQSIEDPGAALAVLLEDFGMKTRRDRDWIILVDSGHRAQVELVPGSNARKGALIHLEFSFEFARGDRLVMSVPGFGDNYIDAVPDAWTNFAAGALPVILAAFLAETSRHAQQEEWTTADRRWLVTRGDFVLRPPHISPGRLPRDLPARLRQMTEQLPLESGVHCVQFFYSRAGENRRPFVEALLDNQPCQSVQSALASMDFPDLGERYSVGQFFVLLPLGRARS